MPDYPFLAERKDDLEKFNLLPEVQMTKSASYAKAINIFTMTSKGVIYYLQIAVRNRILHNHLIQLPKSDKGQIFFFSSGKLCTAFFLTKAL